MTLFKKIAMIFGMLLIIMSNLSATVSQQERDALLALYDSTYGLLWVDNTNWGTGDPCTNSWYGVTCSDNKVVELDLSKNQLREYIPAEIGNLTYLTYLYLDGNDILGSIPTEIGNLTNLIGLYLFRNQLTGSIPAEIGNLTNLLLLDLSENQLDGNIPIEIGNLTNLILFYLDVNDLTGSIPTEIGNLTNLRELYLSRNQLTGSIPAEIGNLTNLQVLYSKSNKLTGSIPVEIMSLTNLNKLYLRNNCSLYSDDIDVQQFIDAVRYGDTYQEILDTNSQPIASQQERDALVALYDSMNGDGWTNNYHWKTGFPCTDTWYGVTCTNNKVTGLNLQDNQLTGSIPTEIGNLTNLTNLSLDVNDLTGSIPAEIVYLTNLENLFLTHNCSLYSDDIEVQQFIDGVGGDTYQDILDTNTCAKSNSVLTPVIMYLLN